MRSPIVAAWQGTGIDNRPSQALPRPQLLNYQITETADRYARSTFCIVEMDLELVLDIQQNFNKV